MNIKKGLALLLTAAMAISTAAITAFAADEPEARIGTAEYATVAEAIKAANDGDTVVLQKDISITKDGYKISKSLTVDLNGKTITATDGEQASAVFIVLKDGVVLTLNGNGGTVDSKEFNYGIYIGTRNVQTNPKVIINGGTYMGSAGGCIFAVKGDVIINDGTFGCVAYDGRSYVLNKLDSTKEQSNFVVYGGTFINLDPSNNYNENPAENQVADGYAVVSETVGEDTYYTVAKKLENAAAFVSTDDETNTPAGYFFNVTKAADNKKTAVATFTAEDTTIEKTLDLSPLAAIDGAGDITFSILLRGAPSAEVTGTILYK